jgi:KipI family sensor histidine kinase inhibitor
MTNRHNLFPRFSPVGDSALLIEFGEVLSPAVNKRVHVLDDWLRKAPLPGVMTWVPGYASLLIIYDPLKLRMPQIHEWLQERWSTCPERVDRHPEWVEVPVRYGGEDGPDLAFVADFHHLTQAEVVARHTAPVYRVGMMGFTPGFAYLLGLDPGLATPRLANPRTFVPAGSVGIAGAQTGIYPMDSPGGWQIIGKTARVLFDRDHEPHFLLSPGDEVRFVVAEGSMVR